MAQSDTSQSGALPTPPIIPGGQEVYDRLMGEIEPELTTTQMPLLKAKYAGESPDQAKARAARYEQAFAEYDKRYQQYLFEQESTLRNYQRHLSTAVESFASDDDRQQLQQLENNFSSL